MQRGEGVLLGVVEQVEELLEVEAGLVIVAEAEGDQVAGHSRAAEGDPGADLLPEAAVLDREVGPLGDEADGCS